MRRPKPELRIGTSGYQYRHWRDIFYPSAIPQGRWLAYYSERFDTVEINNTFYHLPSPESFDRWREQAPEHFLYTLKFSRYGTHMRKLKEPEEPIGRFMDLAQRLDRFLGPILVQLPPHWRINTERLSEFLRLSPPGPRWAIEFRDASWLHDEVYAILRERNAALCIHDLLENHPHQTTADWVYWRFHGTSGHAGNYSAEQLQGAADEVRAYLARGLDVFVYFNNDVHGHAIANALDLKRILAGEKGTGGQESE